MARRHRGNAPRQVPSAEFSQQASAKSNFAMSAARATGGQSGNTGLPSFDRAKKRRAVMGSSLNFARRGRRKGRTHMRAQMPAASSRQYQQAQLAGIPS